MIVYKWFGWFKTKIYFSYDCAVKNLGVCVVWVNVFPLWFVLRNQRWVVKNIVKIQLLATIDINPQNLPTKDMHVIARNLYSELSHIDAKWGPPTKILYEFQMIQNDKSRMVSHFISYHYQKYDQQILFAANKNKINLGPLTHRDYYQKYANGYQANKHHSVGNLKYWLSIMEITCSGKKLDDKADAFLQFIYYFTHNI